MKHSAKIENVQYDAYTAITGAIKGTLREAIKGTLREAIKGTFREAIKGTLKVLSRTGTGIFRW